MLALVPEGLRSRVTRVMIEGSYEDIPVLDSGEPGDFMALEVLPGQNPLRPVIREVATGRLVAGSGRYPNANNPAAVGASTAYKRSKSYREAIEAVIQFENEDARYSVERLIDDAFDAAEGSPTTARCPHCHKDGLVVQKKDGNLIFKLIELLVGKAPQTIEVKGDISHRLVEVMNATGPATVITMSKADWEAREASLIAKGVIDPEWLEGNYRELPAPSAARAASDATQLVGE